MSFGREHGVHFKGARKPLKRFECVLVGGWGVGKRILSILFHSRPLWITELRLGQSLVLETQAISLH